jgi:hypothetical protein
MELVFALNRACYHLKIRLTYFCASTINTNVRENTLAPDDWLVLEKLHSSLNIFYLATMHTQGNEHTASLYLSEMQYLLDRLFDIQVDYAEQGLKAGRLNSPSRQKQLHLPTPSVKSTSTSLMKHPPILLHKLSIPLYASCGFSRIGNKARIQSNSPGISLHSMLLPRCGWKTTKANTPHQKILML